MERELTVTQRRKLKKMEKILDYYDNDEVYRFTVNNYGVYRNDVTNAYDVDNDDMAYQIFIENKLKEATLVWREAKREYNKAINDEINSISKILNAMGKKVLYYYKDKPNYRDLFAKYEITEANIHEAYGLNVKEDDENVIMLREKIEGAIKEYNELIQVIKDGANVRDLENEEKTIKLREKLKLQQEIEETNLRELEESEND